MFRNFFFIMLIICRNCFIFLRAFSHAALFQQLDSLSQVHFALSLSFQVMYLKSYTVQNLYKYIYGEGFEVRSLRYKLQTDFHQSSLQMFAITQLGKYLRDEYVLLLFRPFR